jgi:small subunit ribosomal protein S6
MALYETVFIARQDISSAQAETLAESYSQMIADNGGKVTKTEHWGLKTLAFRMNKNRKGHYVLFNIDAPSAAVLEMERNMRINEDVLRYMTIRVEEAEEGPAAIAGIVVIAAAWVVARARRAVTIATIATQPRAWEMPNDDGHG